MQLANDIAIIQVSIRQSQAGPAALVKQATRVLTCAVSSYIKSA